MTTTPHFTMRLATEADRGQLDELAALDSAKPLHPPAILGELDGALVAARSLRDGCEIADPFRATSDVTALLRTRASQLTVHRSPRRMRRPRLSLAWSG